MDRVTRGERVDRAPMSLPPSMSTSLNSMHQLEAARAEAARAAAEELAAAQMKVMTARLDMLEEKLRRLTAYTVQQGMDGKVYLPYGSRLRIQTGRLSLTMDSGRFVVEADGRPLLSAVAPTYPTGA
jgi:hypothetical protein